MLESTFNKVADLWPGSFKRDSNTGVFLWSLQNFSEHLFWWTSVNDCFWRCSIKKLFFKTLQYWQDKSSFNNFFLKKVILVVDGAVKLTCCYIDQHFLSKKVWLAKWAVLSLRIIWGIFLVLKFFVFEQFSGNLEY